MIAPAVTNTGTIEVTRRRRHSTCRGRSPGRERTKSRALPRWSSNSTVAAGQTVSFTGSGGTLDLGAPQGFAGKISGFDTVGAGSNDTIEVAAPWVFSGFTENAGGTQGTLRFANGASTLSLTLLGDYNPADFVHQTQANGSTLITYIGNSLLHPVSGAETHAGEFGFREASAATAGGYSGVGASWDGSMGHGPGPS